MLAVCSHTVMGLQYSVRETVRVCTVQVRVCVCVWIVAWVARALAQVSKREEREIFEDVCCDACGVLSYWHGPSVLSE